MWEIKIADIVVMLSTVVVAVFTGCLWWSTHRLWKASKETKEFANRAWVFAAPSLGTIKPSGDRISLNLFVVNSGNSPARIRELLFCTEPAQPMDDESIFAKHILKINFPLGPRGDRWCAQENISVPDNSFVFGCVKYVDCFGLERWSRYCGQVRINQPPYYFVAGAPYWSEFS